MAWDIVVVGAGVCGLSSAVNIQEAFPTSTVTVIADKFSPDTTSDGSGGFWEPYSLQDTPLHKIRYHTILLVPRVFIVAFLQNASIEYSPESLCVRLCVCVFAQYLKK